MVNERRRRQLWGFLKNKKQQLNHKINLLVQMKQPGKLVRYC